MNLQLIYIILILKPVEVTLLQSWPIHTWQKDTKRSGVIVPFKKIPTSANDFGMVSGRSRRTKRFTDFKK